MRIHNTEPNSVMCKTTYCWQGLASTEDFTSVQLRRGQAVPHQNLLPYREKMLLQVNLTFGSLIDCVRLNVSCIVPFLEDHVSKYEMERKKLWVCEGENLICIL
jgi:hypothetical protein